MRRIQTVVCAIGLLVIVMFACSNSDVVGPVVFPTLLDGVRLGMSAEALQSERDQVRLDSSSGNLVENLKLECGALYVSYDFADRHLSRVTITGSYGFEPAQFRIGKSALRAAIKARWKEPVLRTHYHRRYGEEEAFEFEVEEWKVPGGRLWMVHPTDAAVTRAIESQNHAVPISVNVIVARGDSARAFEESIGTRSAEQPD